MPVYNYTTLDDPSAGSGGATFAFGINDAGQIVGFYQDSLSHQHGFLYSGGTYTAIDDPLGTNGTVATGINNAGQIVGNYSDSSFAHHGFFFNGAFDTLDDPSAADGLGTLATGVNDLGWIVGVYYFQEFAFGFLTGDVNANRIVDRPDLQQVQTDRGQAVTASNFRDDINLNGVVDRPDQQSVQINRGHSIP